MKHTQHRLAVAFATLALAVAATMVGACQGKSGTDTSNAANITLERLQGTWTASAWTSNGRQQDSPQGLRLQINADSSASFTGCPYAQIDGRIRIRGNTLNIIDRQIYKFFITRLSNRTIELNFWRNRESGVDVFTLQRE